MLTCIDMSEYQEKFSATRLIGAPPGYVGYDEGGYSPKLSATILTPSSSSTKSIRGPPQHLQRPLAGPR